MWVILGRTADPRQGRLFPRSFPAICSFTSLGFNPSCRPCRLRPAFARRSLGEDRNCRIRTQRFGNFSALRPAFGPDAGATIGISFFTRRVHTGADTRWPRANQRVYGAAVLHQPDWRAEAVQQFPDGQVDHAGGALFPYGRDQVRSGLCQTVGATYWDLHCGCSQLDRLGTLANRKQSAIREQSAPAPLVAPAQ
jgi:hypothetical protein